MRVRPYPSVRLIFGANSSGVPGGRPRSAVSCRVSASRVSERLKRVLAASERITMPRVGDEMAA